MDKLRRGIHQQRNETQRPDAAGKIRQAARIFSLDFFQLILFGGSSIHTARQDVFPR